MSRKIEIDLNDIISLWNSVQDCGIHEYELAVFIPDDLSTSDIDNYCKSHMPLDEGYTIKDDWASFKAKVAELFEKRRYQKWKNEQ